MMGMMGKRITSLLLACLMVLSLLPAPALADDDTGYSFDGNDTLTITGEEIDKATLANKDYVQRVKHIKLGKNALISEVMMKKGYKLFSYFDKLVSIEVEPGNAVFKDIDGVLFSADGVVLYAYPASKPGDLYILPDSVTKLGEEAFYGAAPAEIYARASTVEAIKTSWTCHLLSDFNDKHKIHENYINVTGVKLMNGGEAVLPEAGINVYREESVNLTADVSFASEGDDTINSVTWKSDDERIAKVENGQVTGVSLGTTTITATTVGVGANDQPLSASCKVTVENNVTSFVITGLSENEIKDADKTEAEITRTTTGDPIILSGKINNDAKNKIITWKITYTDDTSVATLADPSGVEAEDNGELTLTADDDGLTSVRLVPNKSGHVKITAQAKDFRTGVTTGTITFDVTLITPATGVELNKNTLDLTIREADSPTTGTLTATYLPTGADPVTWKWEISGEDKGVISLNNNGPTATITAVSSGTATVTASATSYGKTYTAACKVTVTVATVGLEIDYKKDEDNENDKKVIELVYGSATGSGQKTVTAIRKAVENFDHPTDEPELVWSTGDQDIVTVTKDGAYSAILTPKRAGKTTLTVQVKDYPNIMDECEVYVFTPANGITLDKSSMELKLGSAVTTGDLTATIIDAGSSSDSTAKQAVEWKIVSQSPNTDGGGDVISLTEDPTKPAAEITALKPGTATVRATAKGTTYYADCTVTVLQPTTDITLTPNNPLSLDINGTNSATLTAVIAPFDTTDPVTWSVDTEGVVELGEAKTVKNDTAKTLTVTMPVTAIGDGKATVTVTSGDVSKTCTINVPVPVTGVKLNKETLTLKKDATETLTATVLPTDAINKGVTWRVEDEDPINGNGPVVSVGQDGLVTAKAPGTATITVTTADGGFTASCAVTVLVSTTSIKLIDEEAKDEENGKDGEVKEEIELTYGTTGSGQKVLTVVLESGTDDHAPTDDPELVWTVKPANIVSVTTEGKITDGQVKVRLTALQPSATDVTVTVSVKDNPNISAGCTVRVYSPAAGLKLSQEAMLFTLTSDNDEPYNTLTATVLDANNFVPSTAKQNIEWKIIPEGAEDKVISLGEITDEVEVPTAKITALGPGTATVRATVVGTGYTKDCVVTVLRHTGDITLKAGDTVFDDDGLVELTLNSDDNNKIEITATISPYNTTDEVTWSVYPEGIVTLGNVDDKQTSNPSTRTITIPITAVSAGDAIITVTSGNETRACKINVKIDVKSVSLDKEKITLVEGEKQTLTAIIDPPDATYETVEWNSGDTSVAKVDNGIVTAVGAGTARITATVAGKMSESCEVTVLPHTTGVTLKVDDQVLYCNGVENSTEGDNKYPKKTTLTVTITPVNSPDEATWSVSPEGIVSLGTAAENEPNSTDSTRTITIPITAKAPGTATVTVTSHDQSQSITVTVKARVESISLDEDEITLVEGEKQTLTATITPSNATNQTVTWDSDGPSVAKVDNGVVTAVGEGTARITVTTEDGGETATCTVTVIQHTTEVTLAATSDRDLDETGKLVLYCNGDDNNHLTKTNLTAKITPAGSKDAVTWSVSPGGVVIMGEATEAGKSTNPSTRDVTIPITAVAPGTAVVTVTSNGHSASYPVTVKRLVESISLDQTTLTVAKNGEATITATVSPADASDTAVTWSVNSNAVEIIKQSGNSVTIRGLTSEGTCTVTATAKDGSGKTATCSVTVASIPVSRVSFVGGNSYTLRVGDTINITAAAYPEDAGDRKITFTGNGSDILELDSTGKEVLGRTGAWAIGVTAKKVGTATITATSVANDKLFDICTVTVEPIPVQSVTLTGSTAFDLNNKKTQTFTATIDPNDATEKEVLWTSSDPEVADVEVTPGSSNASNGQAKANVTANAPGTVTITATAKGTSVKDSITFTVPVNVTGLGLDRNKLELVVGETATLTPKITPSNADNKGVTWESDKPAVATVNGNGVVTAVSDGTAKITVTADDNNGNNKAECTVTVNQESIKINSSNFTTAADGTKTLTLKPDGTATLTAGVTPDYANQTVKWTVGNESVATLHDDGNGQVTVTAHANGITTITATTADGRAADSCVVKVETPATGVHIRDLSLNQYVSDTKVLYIDDNAPLLLVAEVLPVGATYTKVEWGPNNSEVITIKPLSTMSAAGEYVEITAKKSGTVNVTVTITLADNSTYDYQFTVEVRQRAKNLVMSSETLILAVEGSGQLTVAVDPSGAYVSTLRWSSSDPNVVSVSDAGTTIDKSTGKASCKVNGNAAGKATITATSVEDGSLQAQCVVRVYQPVTKLEIRNRADGQPVPALTLSTLDTNGPAAELKPILTPANATVDEYEWTYENDGGKNVIEVTSDGEVYVRGDGTATITLTAKTPAGDKTATCSVTVNKAEPAVEPSTEGLYTPDMGAVTFTISPIDAASSDAIGYEYKYGERVGDEKDVTKAYDNATHTCTYSIKPSQNGEFTFKVTFAGSKTCEAITTGTTYNLTSVCNPITAVGINKDQLAAGDVLTAKVDNTDHIIYMAGSVNAATVDLPTYKLVSKLDLTLFGDENDGNRYGLTAYLSEGLITVMQDAKVIRTYTLNRSGVVSLPENIDLTSSIVLVGDNISSADVKLTEETKEALKAAAAKVLSEEAEAKDKVDVTLKITENSFNGVESVSLDIKPTYTITKEDGETVSGIINTLAAPIQISVVVSFEPAAIVHTKHDNTYELLAFNAVDNHDGTWTVTWSQQTFSEVRLLAASEVRSGSIRFNFYDGSYAQFPYDETDVGKAFKKDSREGYTFSGWTVAGMTGVDTLTDALLSAINGKTVTATPVFTLTGEDTPKDDTPASKPSTPNSGTGTNNNTPPTDGPTTETIKNADGSTTTTVILPDGSRGVTVTNADGTTRSASATITAKAAEAARQSNKPVTVPVRVAVSPSSETAAVVTVKLPKTDTPLRLAIPAGGAGPATVAVLVHDDGTEEIIINSIVVDGAVVFYADGGVKVKILDNIKDFDDVDESFWGSEAVRFVTARGIFNGKGGRVFSPNEAMTRGMLSQVLYNFDGGTVGAASRSAFGDVTEDDWFFEAVSWCSTAGIMNGYPDGTFGGTRDISRQELITCLYRYAQSAGLSTDAAAKLDGFPDAGSVQSYARDAMSWAVGTGLIVGTNNGVLDPGGRATRAQVATIMMRFCYLKFHS